MDGIGDCLGVLRVLLVVALDQDDIGVSLLRFSNLCPGLDAKRLRLITGGDAAGSVRHGRHHGQGPPAIFRVQLLLH